MSSWRTFLIGAVAIVATSIVGGELTSIHVVLPPMIAALVVLLGAALAVDFFGLQRRHVGWHGHVQPSASSRARLRALDRQYRREREAGSFRAPATARSLLVALAEHDELRHAGDLVDFLAADAATRAHRDLVADALRALALAELGRAPEARRIDDALGARAGVIPVVAYARARLAELAGSPAAALAHVERGLGARARRGEPVQRDLALVRARLLLRLGRRDDARHELAAIAAAAGRAPVEQLVSGRNDPDLALVAREALGLATVYR